jgi:lipoprotein-anchoring transpeptidase ErfK/SrfK
MNDRFIQSREALAHAREALKNGAKEEARKWAEHAANLAPQSEDPWLVLATVALNPQESVEYVNKALQLNPNSMRARKGMEWALQRVRENPRGNATQTDQAVPKFTQRPAAKRTVQNETVKKAKRTSRLLPILLVSVGCAVFAFAAWSAVNSPALAFFLNITQPTQSQAAHGPLFAQVNIPKPTYTPAAEQPVADVILPSATTAELAAATETPQQQIQSNIVIVPTVVPPTITHTTPPTLEAVILPTDTPFVEQAPTTAEVTSDPGNVFAQIVEDTPTSEFIAPTALPYVQPVASNGGEHWIDVNLSEQRVYAYEGDSIVNSFLVSTGVWQTPTVTGKYHIWIKLLSTTMIGPGYYLPNVPYTMYFYKGYGLHGTYWHNNFGTPMSHGCVNLRTSDAEWLYNFSAVGTLVNVHY